MTFDRIAVIGAGAWGTALASAIARADRPVLLAARDKAEADAIEARRESSRLPGVKLDERIGVAPLSEAVGPYDAILLAVPAQDLRSAAEVIAATVVEGTPVVACAKGIERGSHKFMTEVIAECAPTALPAILSGPSFAADVARGLPTAVTLAAGDESVAAELARCLGSATFRLYHSTDMRGVEIGGAAKNVLAIAAGIVAGRGLGASAAAAVTTRGFAELFRFGKALWRARRDVDRPVGTWRPDPDLLEPAVAQLFARRRARPGAFAVRRRSTRWRKVRSPRRCCSISRMRKE